MSESSHAEWVARQLSRAVRAYRSGERDGVLPMIDEVLARFHDDIAALELGARLARALSDQPRRVRYLATALALDPTRSSRRLSLATALLETGLHLAALDVVEPLVLAQPDSRPALKVQLQALLADGGGDALQRRLDALASAGRNDKRLALWVATVLRDSGNRERTLQWLDRGWPFSGEPDFALRRARQLYEARRYQDADAAFAACHRTARTDDERAEALLFRGRIARNTGDRETYSDLLREVFMLTPANGEAAIVLSQHLIRQGDVAAARNVEEKHEAAAPESAALTWIQGRIDLAEGRHEDAVRRYRVVLERCPDVVEHYWRFGDMLIELRHLDEAAAILNRGAEIAPDSLRIFSRRIRVQELLRRPLEETLHICDELLALRPREESALLQRANLLSRVGRRDDALAQYVAGTHLFPRNTNFWRSAARLAMNLTRHEQARDIAAGAMRVFNRDEADDRAACAEIAEAAGLIDDALEAIDRALEIDPRNPSARVLAARLATIAGDFPTAWRHLQCLHANPARSQETLVLFARVAAALAFLPNDTADKRLPDALFSPLLRKLGINDDTAQRLVLHVSSSLASGGAERQVALTVTHLASRPHAPAVELVADDLAPHLGRDFFLSEVDEARVPIHVLRELALTGPWRDAAANDAHSRRVLRALAPLPDDLRRLTLGLYAVFHERRPGIVHLWQDLISVAGGLAAALAGVERIILGVRSTRPVEHQRARRYFRAAYRALLDREGVVMVANSANGARDYERWLGLAEGTIIVIHNGFDFDRMRERATHEEAVSIRKQLSIPAHVPVLGGVMRCSFEKRPDLWTSVATRLVRQSTDLHAVLVGEGPMRHDLIREVAALGLERRIHFVGRKSPIEPWLRTMSLVLLSSKTEGLPNVLVEAQGVGTPVATVRVGGAPEAVDDGRTGIVVDSDDPDALSTAIAPLLFDPSRRASLGTAGIAWADRTFGIERTVDRLLDLYEPRETRTLKRSS